MLSRASASDKELNFYKANKVKVVLNFYFLSESRSEEKAKQFANRH